jgi:hypothetical protein
MSYMDALRGTSRTNAPIVKVATIHDSRSASWHGEAWDHDSYEDSASFRATRAIMANRTGVCG